MIVICEDCGKKYRINPTRIKGKAASFKCRVCGHQILVKKAKSPPPEPADPRPDSEPQVTADSVTVAMDVDTAAAVTATRAPEPTPAATEPESPPRARRFGLRAKMLLLFLLIPTALMAAASVFYLWQLQTTTNLLAGQGAEILSQMAEEKIADISAAVATQCKLYLLSHPELEKENFNRDPGFKSLAVQKVGSTGYTALYQRPGADGIWRTWAHVNPKIIAIDMSTLKKTLKDSFAGFWKVFTGVKGGRISQGYYTWQDKDKKFRHKFMVCTPIAGTRFVVAATTYQDELTESARMLEAGADAFNDKAQMNTLGILGAILLLIGLIVLICSHRLTAKIRSLAEDAQLIAAGEPGRKIKIRSRDELGDLAAAIAKLRHGISDSAEKVHPRD